MRRRHLVFIAIVSLAAASFAVGTGADTVTYDNVDTLELQPAGDGAYVQENGDGEISVVVGEEGPGVKDDGITDLGAVFTVENVLQFGDPTAETANRVTIWIETDGNDAVTFYDTDTGEPIETKTHGVVLSPGEMARVGMMVDTTGPAPDITTLTVHATVEDLDFDSVEITPDDETLELNETRDVTATAVAGDERIDISGDIEITDSNATVKVDESGSVPTITAVNPGSGPPSSGHIEVAVGEDTFDAEFDVDWRETTTPVDGKEGEVTTFEELGVLERIEFEDRVEGEVRTEAFEELPESTEVSDEEVLQVVEVDVPEEYTDTDATLRFTLDSSTVDADLDDLTVVYGPGGEFATFEAGDFETLDTDAYVDGNAVVVEADTPGFSAFAVTDGSLTADSSTKSSSSGSSSNDDDDDADDSDAESDADGSADDSEGGATADDPDATGGSAFGGTEAGENDGTGGDTAVADDSPLPVEIGGIVSGPLWHLLTGAAATLLLTFAYRRRNGTADDRT